VDALQDPTFIVIERLVISAMVIATLDILAKYHGESNHAFWDLPSDESDNNSMNVEDFRFALQKYIRSFYSGSEAVRDPNILFVALYF